MLLCVCVCVLCPTLCNAMDCNPPVFSVHGILQARTLEWAASLLQGIFPTQGLDLHLLHWQADSLPPSHLESLCISLPGPRFFIICFNGKTGARSFGWEDPLEKEKAYPLQYSGLENSMDCMVHEVAKSQTRLRGFHFLKLGQW